RDRAMFKPRELQATGIKSGRAARPIADGKKRYIGPKAPSTAYEPERRSGRRFFLHHAYRASPAKKGLSMLTTTKPPGATRLANFLNRLRRSDIKFNTAKLAAMSFTSAFTDRSVIVIAPFVTSSRQYSVRYSRFSPHGSCTM